MSDLIERLRAIANDQTYCNGRMCAAESFIEDAADELERFTEWQKRERKLRKRERKLRKRMMQEQERLTAENELFRSVVQDIANNPDCEYASCGIAARQALADTEQENDDE